ncbi:MAG: hypothetical protein D6743_15985, partial [Calditrichaeota bacterium]
EMWRGKYERLFKIGAFINQRLSAYTDEKWNRRIRELSRLSPELVASILQGEFDGKLLGRIVVESPAFFGKAVLAALRRMSKTS